MVINRLVYIIKNKGYNFQSKEPTSTIILLVLDQKSFVGRNTSWIWSKMVFISIYWISGSWFLIIWWSTHHHIFNDLLHHRPKQNIRYIFVALYLLNYMDSDRNTTAAINSQLYECFYNYYPSEKKTCTAIINSTLIMLLHKWRPGHRHSIQLNFSKVWFDFKLSDFSRFGPKFEWLPF